MSKIREILDNLSTEQYKMMIGEKSCQPLTEAFSKKREFIVNLVTTPASSRGVIISTP